MAEFVTVTLPFVGLKLTQPRTSPHAYVVVLVTLVLAKEILGTAKYGTANPRAKTIMSKNCALKIFISFHNIY
jgi:hypothetical protein